MKNEIYLINLRIIKLREYFTSVYFYIKLKLLHNISVTYGIAITQSTIIGSSLYYLYKRERESWRKVSERRDGKTEETLNQLNEEVENSNQKIVSKRPLERDT